MRKFIKLLVLSSVVLTGVQFVQAQCHLSQEKGFQGDRFILENELIRVEALSFGGRIHSLRLKSSGTEFLEPIEESISVRSPLLPPNLISNQAGFADWFWGERPPESLPYQTEIVASDEEKVEIKMKGRSGPWVIEKWVRLKKGSKVLEQEIEIAHADGIEATLSYWAHLIPNAKRFTASDGSSRLILPGKRGGNTILQRTTETLPKEGVQVVTAHQSNDFYELQEPWVAIVDPDNGEALVLRSTQESFGKDGLFYHWQNGTISTMELIHTPRKLSPSQSARFRVELEPFNSEKELLSSTP